MKNLCIIFLILSSFSCSSVPKNSAPDWIYNVHSVFSEEEYLATDLPGTGNSAENARTDAVGKLSQYINSQITSEITSEFSENQKIQNGKIKEQNNSSMISSYINIKSETNLYALETTSPYYDKNQKKWFVCAYINKDKAFAQIKNELDNSRTLFFNAYEKAGIGNDFIERLHLYKIADEYGQEYAQKYAYGLLFTEKVKQEYGNDMNIVFGIPSEVQNLKSKFPIFIKVKNDNKNAILSSVAKVLQDKDFYVVDFESSSSYVANVNVNFQIKEEKDVDENENNLILYSVVPEMPGIITFSLSNQQNQDKYSCSFQIEVEKKASYIKENVLNAVYTETAEKFKTELSKNLTEQFGA